MTESKLEITPSPGQKIEAYDEESPPTAEETETGEHPAKDFLAYLRKIPLEDRHEIVQAVKQFAIVNARENPKEAEKEGYDPYYGYYAYIVQNLDPIRSQLSKNYPELEKQILYFEMGMKKYGIEYHVDFAKYLLELMYRFEGKDPPKNIVQAPKPLKGKSKKFALTEVENDSDAARAARQIMGHSEGKIVVLVKSPGGDVYVRRDGYYGRYYAVWQDESKEKIQEFLAGYNPLNF